MQKQKSGFSLLFLIFLICTRQVGWQGYGNMSSSNLTEIWAFVNTHIASHTGDSSYDAFNIAFSDHLNDIWAPAWNVFTIKTTSAFDTVLFGYAFRDHWMWFNDFEVNGVVLAFVIWKDFNCIEWRTVGKNGGESGFDRIQLLRGYVTKYRLSQNDLWNSAVYILDVIESEVNYNNVQGGFSIVVSQDKNADFYGRVCVVTDNKYYYSRRQTVEAPFYDADQNKQWGTLLFFRTR